MADTFERLKSALADRYRMEREIGSGGMATVYVAEDVKHRRQVAIKVLKPDLAAAVGPDRFLREVEIAARLRHPNILPLYDSGETDGLLYYGMPFVRGDSLRGRLDRERQLPVEDAVSIAREVAEALGSAHAEKVVHRDIKPENIMLEAGHAVVADFGIALAVSAVGEQRLTETGITLGTPSYMSPEQAGGAQDIDGRSDIYSLACLLYEMLAGEPPFSGATVQAILARHLTDSAPPIATVRPSVPPPVAAAMAKALAKTAADRYPSARAFADALLAESAVVKPEELSIVVLPFANLSADPENDYFGDGLTEEIITDLSKLRALRVISRNTAMQLKGTTKDTKAIGHELDVRYVLGGSVRRAGHQLRITAHLIDALHDSQLWAEKYAGTMEDVFGMQEQVSRSIVDALEVQLSPAEARVLEHRPTENLEAYDCYLLGRHYFHQFTVEGIHKALEYYEQAVALDPKYAPAHAGLAYVYLSFGDGGFNLRPAREAIPAAKASAERAIKIDPSMGDAHALLGLIHCWYEWNWAEAEHAIRRAIALTPSDVSVWVDYSILLSVLARHDEAISAIERAKQLDPLSPYVHVNAAMRYGHAGHLDRGLEQCDRTLQLAPGMPWGVTLAGEFLLVQANVDDALRTLEPHEAVLRGMGDYPAAVLGHALALTGRTAEAEVIAKEVEDRCSQGHGSYLCVALVHLGLGDAEKALADLERAVRQNPPGCLTAYLGILPLFAALRGDQRFQATLRALGLATSTARGMN